MSVLGSLLGRGKSQKSFSKEFWGKGEVKTVPEYFWRDL